MKKFNSLNELNDYVNSNPIDINDIDIDSLTVKTTSKMTTFGVMTTEKEYPCYIIFNDKSSYQEYKEAKQIDADLHSINAIQINITLNEFKRLKPNVRFIEFIDINEKATLAEANNESSEPVNTNWGADIANVQESWAKGYTGKGVKVACIDTGFISNPNFLNFKEHIIFDEASNKSHGTACASVICSLPSSKYLTGIAHGCDMYALETNMLTTAMMQAYQWCIDNGMDIITTSIVSNSDFDWGIPETSRLLYEEVVARGIIFVAAAGNRNKYQFTFPAFIDGVIAVSAIAHVRSKLTKVSWDNTTSEGGGLNQPWLDFIFAGTNVKIASIYNTGSTASGTSVSAPAIAGMFALLKEEFPNKTRSELVSILKSNSFKIEGRYGVYPVYTDYENKQIENNRIAKINKDGSINIKGEIIIDENCEKTMFDKHGNLYLKNFSVGVSYERDSHDFSFGKNSVDAKYIIENSDI